MSDINYNFAPQNPMPGMMQALQFGQYLGGVRDQRAQASAQAQALQQAAQEKAARDAQASEVMAAIEKNPSGENFMKLVNLSSPKDAEGVRATWAQMDKATQQSMLTESMKVFALLENNEKERAKKELEARRDGYSNAGNKDGAAKTQAWIDMLDAGKEQVVKNIYGMMITTIPGGKDAIDALAKLGEEQRAERLAELQGDNPGKVLDPKDIEASENLLRKEYDNKQSVFKQIGNFYNVITNADANSIGDIALISTYMKILDPNSVVREGEFATAANAGGVPSSIVAAYNQALGTGKIDEKVRQQIYSQSKKIYDSTKAQNEADRAFYTDIANRRGLNVDNIIYNVVPVVKQPGISGQSATFAELKAYAKQRNPNDAKDIDSFTDEKAFRAKYKNTAIAFDAGSRASQSTMPQNTSSEPVVSGGW